MIKLKYIIVVLVSLLATRSFGQGTVVPCEFALPFCSDSTYVFENNHGGTVSAPSFVSPDGPNYGCLANQPNPIWYYFQVDEPGPIELTVTQIGLDGSTDDIDFAMWGPFTSVEDGCEDIMSGDLPPLQCSYSASYTETIAIGMPGGAGAGASTPPAGVTGEIYIVILTNYSCDPGTITFAQTDGTGTTDCSIVKCSVESDNSGPICQGATVQLFAQELNEHPGVSYNWSGPGGFTSSLKNPTLSINTAGDHNFTCEIIVSDGEDADTCVTTTTVTVYPQYNFPTNVEICAGNSYEYNGQVYTQTGVYSQTYTTADGCDSIMTLNLTVNPLPDVRIAASSTSICEGDFAILTIDYPSPNNNYQWFRDGMAIVDGTTSSIRVSTPGAYKVAVMTNKGCVDTSRQITITVNPNAHVQIADLNVDFGNLCLGDTIDLKVSNPNPLYEYRWSPEKYFRYVEGYRLPEVRAVITQDDILYVKAMNEYGCIAMDSVRVHARPCCDIYLPSAFTPNNDGLNDDFNILLQQGQRILTFQVFDRFGNMVYNNNNPQKGWNGTLNNSGDVVEQGVYYYRINYSCTDGENYEVSGDISLFR